ncbi:hypothetical protein RI367_005052 [Sorochytrium milnesiophthora]
MTHATPSIKSRLLVAECPSHADILEIAKLLQREDITTSGDAALSDVLQAFMISYLPSFAWNTGATSFVARFACVNMMLAAATTMVPTGKQAMVLFDQLPGQLASMYTATARKMASDCFGKDDATSKEFKYYHRMLVALLNVINVLVNLTTELLPKSPQQLCDHRLPKSGSQPLIAVALCCVACGTSSLELYAMAPPQIKAALTDSIYKHGSELMLTFIRWASSSLPSQLSSDFVSLLASQVLNSLIGAGRVVNRLGDVQWINCLYKSIFTLLTRASDGEHIALVHLGTLVHALCDGVSSRWHAAFAEQQNGASADKQLKICKFYAKNLQALADLHLSAVMASEPAICRLLHLLCFMSCELSRPDMSPGLADVAGGVRTHIDAVVASLLQTSVPAVLPAFPMTATLAFPLYESDDIAFDAQSRECVERMDEPRWVYGKLCIMLAALESFADLPEELTGMLAGAADADSDTDASFLTALVSCVESQPSALCLHMTSSRRPSLMYRLASAMATLAQRLPRFEWWEQVMMRSLLGTQSAPVLSLLLLAWQSLVASRLCDPRWCRSLAPLLLDLVIDCSNKDGATAAKASALLGVVLSASEFARMCFDRSFEYARQLQELPAQHGKTPAFLLAHTPVLQCLAHVSLHARPVAVKFKSDITKFLLHLNDVASKCDARAELAAKVSILTLHTLLQTDSFTIAYTAFIDVVADMMPTPLLEISLRVIRQRETAHALQQAALAVASHTNTGSHPKAWSNFRQTLFGQLPDKALLDALAGASTSSEVEHALAARVPAMQVIPLAQVISAGRPQTAGSTAACVQSLKDITAYLATQDSVPQTVIQSLTSAIDYLSKM